MSKKIIEIGDKVICLYRKGNHTEGRIHVGIGVVEYKGVSDFRSIIFYTVKLDNRDEAVNFIDSEPYGAIIPYDKAKEDELIKFHNHSLRLVIAIEDDYFEQMGFKKNER